MSVRLAGSLLLISTVALAGQAGQPPATPPPSQPGATTQPPTGQTPVFRARVDLLSVDATVLDSNGRQITDLKPSEFIIEVDGDARPVVSAEFVKLVDDAPVIVGAPKPRPPAPPADDAFFATNTQPTAPGRSILLLVDQGNIRIGQGRQMMRSAVKFVDQLAPVDRLAMVGIPQGQLVDFTTNHERVREALLATVGHAQPFKGRFNLSLSEAFATYERSDSALRQQVILRECAGVLASPVEAVRCEVEVEQEAGEMINHQRHQTQQSIYGMREVLKSLARLEGPKSVILISEGLVLDGLGSDIDDLAAIAADVRASLDVMLLDVPLIDVSERERPTTPREDRDRQTEGLENLAGTSRGALHRVITSGDMAFERVLRSMAGHYLIGVEAQARDRDGRRHRLSVKTTRRGLTVYSRRGFLATTAPGAVTATEAVSRALRSPLTLNSLPMRLATWTYKEPGGGRVRVLVTAEVDRGVDQSLDYTAGIMVIDQDNKVIANTVEPRTLVASGGDSTRAVYAGSVMVEPGTYLVRFAVADSEGRVGSVDRKVEAWAMNAAGLTVGDLLIAEAPPEAGRPIAAAIEPAIGNGRLVTMMEVYSPNMTQSLASLTARLEISVKDGEPPMIATPLAVAAGPSPEVGVLQGVINTLPLPPGRYVARAVVEESGKPRGHITRPFRVVASTEAATDGSVPTRTSLSIELLQSMVGNIPLPNPKALLEPAVLSAVFGAAERLRPAGKEAIATAKGGQIGPAALDALAAGDQALAAFLRGVDFFAQGQNDRAVQQLQLAMQQAPAFSPARLFLGAALVNGQKFREGAGLLQSITPDVAGPAPVARMAALSWLLAGDANLAIAALEKGDTAATDATSARVLATAYIVVNRVSEALPLIARYLEQHPKDAEALLAGIYATYAMHTPTIQAGTLATDRARALGWSKTYAASKGAHQRLVDTWMAYLQKAQ